MGCKNSTTNGHFLHNPTAFVPLHARAHAVSWRHINVDLRNTRVEISLGLSCFHAGVPQNPFDYHPQLTAIFKVMGTPSEADLANVRTVQVRCVQSLRTNCASR